ncbi:hypothetical protein DSO57_1012426 [Entomophthora muscae]|uniref:Uncharacterized protein n=1 Tax=Entomophthora muscae TaxID=34485 RepID=A0ACC2RKX7_9FUNG|nr:hypothetical protein DSO57_1012426 [Entomophthora muscae]
MIHSPSAYRQTIFRDLLIHRQPGMGMSLPTKPDYDPGHSKRGVSAVLGSAMGMFCFIIFVLFLLLVMALLFVITFYPTLWDTFTDKAREFSQP